MIYNVSTISHVMISTSSVLHLVLSFPFLLHHKRIQRMQAYQAQTYHHREHFFTSTNYSHYKVKK